MIIKYNIERLNMLIKDLFDLTGISISILDTDYKVITNCSLPGDFCSMLQTAENEKSLCSECDESILGKCRCSKKLERHICRAGLCDSAMPIMKYDSIVGYVIMGRIRSVSSPTSLKYFPKTDNNSLRRLEELYKKIPILTETQIDALYDLLPSILFDGAIRIILDPFINEVTDFINSDLQKKLNVETLCEKFHVSANFLYNSFGINLHTTVNEYIISQRLKLAKQLLANTNDKVYMIAERVGISNYTYFCKLFKSRIGISPSEYRKAFQK